MHSIGQTINGAAKYPRDNAERNESGTAHRV